ncbi:Hint domain-containing protein [uncultured Tateyamaria sp.]|uniref:Hint domain-containing protein n=1 Tax=uncultured Tateyamaria sp. TaxID=455651 RepID=UPI00262A5C45|nr:Hint domain-containing protein [uncultured Tateyamaria sp.]
MADIEGDENDNTINGTSGSDNIRGNGGNDTLNGSGGDDTVSGGDGNDNIDGGTGNDTVYGGDGDDTITGGAGDDVIVGGRGDDVMTAGNSSPSDTFVIRDGDGNDTITDFDPGEPDIIRFDMVEMNSFQDVLDRMSSDGPDTVITYDNGQSVRLLNVSPGSLSSTNFQFGPGPVCLGEGTYVETPDGPRCIETLRSGDLVMTLDHGPQPILHVLSETIAFRDRNDRQKPILIARGALGPGLPFAEMCASPQHRVLVNSPATGGEALVAAVKLVGRKGVRRMRGCRHITYFNLLLRQHELILANGCPVETLLLTPYSLLKLAALQIMVDPTRVAMTSARPIVQRDPLLRLQSDPFAV